MSTAEGVAFLDGLALEGLVSERTHLIVEHRRRCGVVRRRGWLLRRMLLTADVAGLLVAMLVAEVVTGSGGLAQGLEMLALVASLPGWIVVAKLYGLYDKDEERTDHSTADEFSAVFHMITVCTFLLWGFSQLSAALTPSPAKLIVFWGTAIVAVHLGRALARLLSRRSISYLQNTVIVGAGDVGQTVARKLLQHPEYGINLVAFVDCEPKERAPELEHVAVLGDVQQLPSLIEHLDVERVIVASPADPECEILDLIRRLNEGGVQVDVVPSFYELIGPGVGLHSVEGVSVLGLPPFRLARSSLLLKRALDVLLAGTALLLLGPLFLVIAVLIKLDSRGPVFFRQERMGMDDRSFRILKFRSMQDGADERKHEFAHLNKHLAPGGDERMFKIPSDPRVTRVGAFLRRYSLDELPQLWNVVRGEMSLVGPRPLILDEHAFVTGWAERRLHLRPGITGLWQALGRDAIPFAEMVRLDYVYVTNWSLLGDISLILRTLPVLTRSSAGSP